MKTLFKQSTTSNSKRGFTLVEMLVVIAVIGVLIALLLPAIQAAREAARQSSCASNMKNIALAMHNYESGHRRLPPSRSGEGGWSAQAQIVPYLEQGSLYDAMDFSQPYGDISLDGIPISKVAVPVYTCPSEPNTHIRNDKYSPISYGVNMGPWFVWDPADKGTGGNGMFYPNRGSSLRRCADGTTNTLMLAEVKTYTGYYRNAGTPGDESIPSDPADICALGGDQEKPDSGHTEWVDGRVHQTGFTATFAPNTEVICSIDGADRDGDYNSWQEGKDPNTAKTYAAVTSRSHHPGMVQAAMMDASVQAFPDGTDQDLWRALSTPGGDENMSLSDL